MSKLQLSILQEQTVSVNISHTRNGEVVDLSTANVYYRIVDAETKEVIIPNTTNADPTILLIPSNVTAGLSGDYLVRVYIDVLGFVDVVSITLRVER